MSLHSLKPFTRFVLSLKAATIHQQWGAQVAKVGGKVFALVGDEDGGITFKVSELSFQGLTSIEGIRQAPYFAKGGWVSVHRTAILSDADLKAYITQSYQMVAGKLTRGLRTELGL